MDVAYGDVGLGGAGGVREWGAGGCWRVDEGVWDKAHAKNKIKNFAKFTKTKNFHSHPNCTVSIFLAKMTMKICCYILLDGIIIRYVRVLS